jgi:hypothetical protein
MDTKEWEKLPKSVGSVQRVQVENGPDGPMILCGIKPPDSEEMQHFGLVLDKADSIGMAQLQILLCAIANNKNVRITYNPSSDGTKNWIVAVRVHAESAPSDQKTK